MNLSLPKFLATIRLHRVMAPPSSSSSICQTSTLPSASAATNAVPLSSQLSAVISTEAVVTRCI